MRRVVQRCKTLGQAIEKDTGETREGKHNGGKSTNKFEKKKTQNGKKSFPNKTGNQNTGNRNNTNLSTECQTANDLKIQQQIRTNSFVTGNRLETTQVKQVKITKNAKP